VRDEACQVPRDERIVLADADTGRLVAYNPRADNRMTVIEQRRRVEGLTNEAFRAVPFIGFRDRGIRTDHLYVGAFA
jgi:hypothetical protein